MILLLFIMMISSAVADPASDQISNFKIKTRGPIGTLTTSNGAPVEVREINTLNDQLLNNEFFMESMSHFVRERIPARVVFAKGTVAFGYFEVTNNITGICKAKLFSKIGKKTPVAVRFSLATKDKGAPDTSRDTKGFSIKFYTEDGNFDIVGSSAPITYIKDPALFTSTTEAQLRNPVTNLYDHKMFWDIFSSVPNSFFYLMYLFSDHATNDGYRHMPGYGIHTYQFYNDNGESCFGRVYFTPDEGIKNLSADEATELSGTDPDYANRDLYNAIEEGNFPSWDVSLQILTAKDVRKAKFDVFDVTKTISADKYPLTRIGKLILNTNPTNLFTDEELIAFSPSNLVPGILGAPDNIFRIRQFAYQDAQRYRLGRNYDKIRVNCPLKTMLSYNRDGHTPVHHNGGSAPFYYPNSYNGQVPYYDPKCPKLKLKVEHDNSNNFDQAAEMYTNQMTKEERKSMITNIADSLAFADEDVQHRAIATFTDIHPDLGSQIAALVAERCEF